MVKTLSILAAAALSLHAQTGSLAGHVTDRSGSALPNARVSATERATQVRSLTSTDSSGAYSLPALPGGEYIVEAQAQGFGSAEPQLVRVNRGQAAQLDLTLDVARISTQVQVTAAALAQNVDEQSKALDIIDSAEIDRRAEYSVAEAIRTVPGVNVMQLGGPGAFSPIRIRGTRATDTSVLIDGIRLRDAAAPQGDPQGFLGDLMIANTDRIEVLRGSGSSLYGTHATGGVINVITNPGGGAFHGELGTEGGGLGLFRNTARASGGALENRLRFAGGVSHLHVGNGVDGDDKYRNVTGNGFVSAQLSSATVLTGRVMAVDTFTMLNDPPYTNDGVSFVPAPNDPDQRRWARATSTLVALSHSWSPRVSTKASYALVSTSRDTRDGPLGTRFEPVNANRNVFDGRIGTVQVRTDAHLGGRHLITAGYEYERERFENVSREFAPGASDVTLRIEQGSHAAFAQAQGRYLDGRLQVLASGRLQRFQLERPTFSDNNPLYRTASLSTPPDARTGDLSASYMLAGTKIRGHVGNGYRSPALYERFGASYFFGSFSAYGDPRLSPERVLAFDGGIDQYFANGRVRMSGTYFYTRIQEAIIFDFSGAITPATDPYGRFGGYKNSGGGLARGLELSCETNPFRSLMIRGAYTYTNADDRVSVFGAGGTVQAARTPVHMFTSTVTKRFGRSLDATMDVAAGSKYLVPFGFPTRRFEFPGRRKADFAASYNRGLSDRHSLRLFTRIENLFNRTYYEEGFPTPGIWAVGGVKWLF